PGRGGSSVVVRPRHMGPRKRRVWLAATVAAWLVAVGVVLPVAAGTANPTSPAPLVLAGVDPCDQGSGHHNGNDCGATPTPTPAPTPNPTPAPTPVPTP